MWQIEAYETSKKRQSTTKIGIVVSEISIQRQLLNEKSLEKGFRPVKSSMRKDWWKTLRPPEPIRSSLKPPTTLKGWRKSILSRVPILTWLWMYQLKWLIDDIIAGVTVAIMRIPQGECLLRSSVVLGLLLEITWHVLMLDTLK